jgi:hypothetical protein
LPVVIIITGATIGVATVAVALEGDAHTSGAASATTTSLARNASKPNNPAPPDGAGSPTPVNVKTFGAVGDGVTNDTAAFESALKSLADAGGGVCLVPEGTYVISASGITASRAAAVSTNVHLVGEGRDASILKINGMPRNHLLQCDGDNWSVENLTFDMGDYTPRVGLAAIACKGNKWRVLNCAIVKSGRWGIAVFGGNNWCVERNYINRTVPGATPPRGGILVTARAGVWSSHGRVINNTCEGVGMTITGDGTIAAGNRVNRSGSGSGMFVQGAPSTHSPMIIGNICSNGSSGYDAAQGGRWWSVNGFEIWAPDALICNNIAHDNDGGGLAIGGQNSVVIGNKSYNNGRGRAGHAGFVARINPAKGASASHSIFIGNSAYDTRYPGHNATQDYGYLEQATGITDVKHVGNDYNRNRVGPTKVQAQGARAVPEQISPELKNRLDALAHDREVPEDARRVLREYLTR